MSFTILALTTALRNSRNDTVCLFGLIASLDDDDEQSARACRLFQQLMRMRRARREGWVRFCRQIGVDPDAITKPFIEGTEWTMKTAEAVFEDLESEAVEESDDAAPIADREFAVFMDAWSDRTDNG